MIALIGPQPTESSLSATLSPRRSATPHQLATLAPQIGVDRDKALQTSSGAERTTRATGEPESFIDLNIYSDEVGLHNPKLACRLLKAILLPRDWEETISCKRDCVFTIPNSPQGKSSILYFILFRFFWVLPSISNLENFCCFSLLMGWL